MGKKTNVENVDPLKKTLELGKKPTWRQAARTQVSKKLFKCYQKKAKRNRYSDTAIRYSKGKHRAVKRV